MKTNHLDEAERFRRDPEIADAATRALLISTSILAHLRTPAAGTESEPATCQKCGGAGVLTRDDASVLERACPRCNGSGLAPTGGTEAERKDDDVRTRPSDGDTSSRDSGVRDQPPSVHEVTQPNAQPEPLKFAADGLCTCGHWRSDHGDPELPCCRECICLQFTQVVILVPAKPQPELGEKCPKCKGAGAVVERYGGDDLRPVSGTFQCSLCKGTGTASPTEVGGAAGDEELERIGLRGFQAGLKAANGRKRLAEMYERRALFDAGAASQQKKVEAYERFVSTLATLNDGDNGHTDNRALVALMLDQLRRELNGGREGSK